MTISNVTKRSSRLAALVLAGSLATTSGTFVGANPAFALASGGYADLVDAVSPSVVFIEVTAKTAPADFRGQMPRGTPFEQLFPDVPKQQVRNGLGSGFIISEDGQIVTNNHVVEGAKSVKVNLADGRSFNAEIIGRDPMTDIALLKISSDEDLPAVSFGASSKMRVGDEVVAVGNPFGLGGTVTSGIVSATARNINSGPYDNFIQTDAAINRGNSGGPLFNAQGEVIGVNTAIFSPDGGSVGIGFAVPSDMVRKVVADLADDGQIQRGWLGVQIKPMSDEIASVLGYDTPRGAMIEAISPDSPAANAGFEKGDIILEFAGVEIHELADLPRAVADTSPDTDAKAKILRKGKTRTLDVTVGILPQQNT